MSYSSQFLEDAWLGDLTTLHQLQFRCRFTVDQALHALCVSPHTYRRWLSDRKPNPTAVRLFAVLAGYIPWHGWDGWEMHNGYLFPPGYVKGGISPGDWFATIFLRQLVTEQRRTIDKLESQIKEIQRDRPMAPVLELVK